MSRGRERRRRPGRWHTGARTLTRTGQGALALGTILFAGSMVLAWPAIAVLGAVPLALLVAALAFVLRRPRIRIERQVHPPRVARGQPAIAYLELTNEGRGTIPTTLARQPYGDTSVETLLPRLLGGQRGVRTYRLPTTRRGIYEIGPVEVIRSDPFDLLRVTQRHAGTDRIVVHPAVLPFRPVPSGITRHLEGPASDTSPEGTITFHRLREYTLGDDLRTVHWKSTAKTGQLIVRHNVDTSQPSTVVLLDVRPSSYPGETFELAVDCAASVTVCASAGRSPVQLRTGTGHRVGGARDRDPAAVLDYLTTVALDPLSTLEGELTNLRRERGGTGLVVVTGPPAPEDLAAVARLRRRFGRLVVVAVTGEPVDLPAYPGVTVVTAGTEHELVAAWNLEVAR